ncbi:MAG: diguanylate cyclase, partial [Desulfobacterales bacterium]|nr:diguanylate cyclase [Desulfobacterales bacterium]
MNERVDTMDATILLVDDQPANLALLVEFLEGRGIEVVVAQNGESALTRAAYVKPELILLDVLMPGVDGFETCRRLKEDPACAETPVIFMTALTAGEEKVKGFEAGGVDYVIKPVNLNEVWARIRTHITIASLQRDLSRKNAELETALATRRRLHRRLEALWRISRLSGESFKSTCDYVLREIQVMTDSPYGFYGFLNEDESEMTVHTWSREVMTDCRMDVKPFFYRIAESGVWGNAVRHRKVIRVNDYARERAENRKGVPEGHLPLTRLLSIPVFQNDRIVAVAAVANKKTDYTDDDIEQLTGFLANVQILIDKKRAEEQLERMAMMDGLTGVYNRRYFDLHLANEWKRAIRERHDIALIMIDIDYFKRFNDTYGHQAGDECLREIASMIREEIKRPGDFAARYGGEEFVCLLPLTDGDGALHMADSIRERL